jgi:uncharacterized protein DUF5666
MGPICRQTGYRAAIQPHAARAGQRDGEHQAVIQEPIQPTSSPGPPVRQGRPRTWRDGRLWIAFVLALLLAVPIVVAVAARGPGPERPLAVGASAAPAASATDKDDDDDQGQGNGQKPDTGLKGNNGNGNNGKGLKGNNGGSAIGPITITAVDGNKLSIKTADGWTRTITTTSSTVITKGGQTIATSALKVGDEIRFGQVRNADGSYAITAIVVPTPEAGGEVTAVTGNSITVKGKGGATRVITVTGSTVYKLGPGAGSKADVKVGSEIEAQGTFDGDTFTAITVSIEGPHLDGVVTAKTGTTIIIKREDGSTATIHVTAATTYAIKSNHAASLADIAVGARVTAEGTLRADGSLDAAVVHGKPAKGPKPGKPDKQVAPSAPPG